MKKIYAPAGMTGLAVEPWSKGEIYAVAADWAQASSPVLVYGKSEGWDTDQCGRQVADYRHSCRAALADLIRAVISSGGDEPDDDVVEAILDAAEDLVPAEVGEMADMLERHGEQFTGNCAEDEAQEWIDEGFAPADADQWCAIGCWDAGTAARMRDEGLTPTRAAQAAQSLKDAEVTAWDAMDESADLPYDRKSKYTDGDPIYSICNNDTDLQELLDADAEARQD